MSSTTHRSTVVLVVCTGLRPPELSSQLVRSSPLSGRHPVRATSHDRNIRQALVIFGVKQDLGFFAPFVRRFLLLGWRRLDRRRCIGRTTLAYGVLLLLRLGEALCLFELLLLRIEDGEDILI